MLHDESATMRSMSLITKILLWFLLTAGIEILLVLTFSFRDGVFHWQIMVGVLGGLAFSFAAGFVALRGFNKRWNALMARMMEMARGEVVAVKAPVGSEKELRELSAGFDQVALIIDRRRKELEDVVRHKVETEVAAEKQQLEAFLRGIGDGVSIVDPDMRVVFMNDAMRKIFGDNVGEYCYRVYENKKEICAGCPVRKAMLTGEVHHSLRRVYDKHGNLLYYESTGSPIRDATGKIIAGLELARDATQRIKLERNVEIRSRQLAAANAQLRRTNEQLARAYEELQQAQIQRAHSEKMASLGILVSGVAHEINNPLNFVGASTKLLASNLAALTELLNEYDELDLSDEQRAQIAEMKEEIEFDFVLDDLQKIVKNILTGAERMKQIVQNLRAFSRMDRGAKEEFNVREGLESTLQILHHQFKESIAIERDYQPVPVIICSPGQINQVFLNILHNAIQAIEGHGRITITTRMLNRKVRVSIADDGPGIEEDDLHQLFDPFFTTKKVGEGTGLGLSISYGIVEDHGGRLWVDSAKGRGTTFHIDLPLVQKQIVVKGA
jgi:PAS domain S-box-containing protein